MRLVRDGREQDGHDGKNISTTGVDILWGCLDLAEDEGTVVKVLYCVVVSFDLVQEPTLHTAFTPTFSGNNMDTEIKRPGETGSEGRSFYLIRLRQHSDPVSLALRDHQGAPGVQDSRLGAPGLFMDKEENRTDCCSCSWEEGIFFYFFLCKMGCEKDYFGGTPKQHTRCSWITWQSLPTPTPRIPRTAYVHHRKHGYSVTSWGAAEDLAMAVFIHQMNEKKSKSLLTNLFPFPKFFFCIVKLPASGGKYTELPWHAHQPRQMSSA